MNRKQLQEYENRVLAQMVWYLIYPGPSDPDEVSTADLVRSISYPGENNRLHGMTEKEVRNAVRRLKYKGLIERSWQKQNPDQPNGEYGEVRDGRPFVPRHGYALSEAGWATKVAKEAKEWVDREWNKSVKELLKPEPETESSGKVEGT